MEQAIEFVPLIDYADYEILSQHPFTVRRKDNHYVVQERHSPEGYLVLNLNHNYCQKHRLIAKQFIQNDDPENKKHVDHINRIRDDNRIENLRWVSVSENMRNTSSRNNVEYEFVDNIPDDAIVVNKYGEHTFENYFYYDNAFYFYNGIQYRKLYINENKRGHKYVCTRNIENKRVKIFYSKFKILYDVD
ncbi:hypothetical protein M9Y10_016303 [Tritrichomonas musculus]|uniref:HNH nuclease domain-containing protein n=1 Tax=Tritrichomonas musculus TaxID=1915356 RepID=A0ABR2HVY5_9EUKA